MGTGLGLEVLVGVLPVQAVVKHHATGGIVADRLHIKPHTMFAGVKDVGIDVGRITGVPVDRTAHRTLFADLLDHGTQYGARVGQVVDHPADCQIVVFVVAVSVQQVALLPDKRAVAPALLGVAPVRRLIDQLSLGGRHLAVLNQTHLHLVNTTGQAAGIDELQARLYRLGIDKAAITIDFNRALAIGRHVDRVNAGAGTVDGQAVGRADHDPDNGIGHRPWSAGLARYPLEVGQKKAGLDEFIVVLALTVQALDRLPGFGTFVTATIDLIATDRGPVTNTALGIHRVTTAGISAAATGHVELIAQYQAVTAALGQLVITGFCRVQLGSVGHQRQQRVLQTVMNRYQAVVTAGGAVPDRARLLKIVAPALAVGGA